MKKAIVTGSTKGIGRAIGQKLLLEGCRVVFNFSADAAAAQKLEDDLDRQGYRGQYRIRLARILSRWTTLCLTQPQHGDADFGSCRWRIGNGF